MDILLHTGRSPVVMLALAENAATALIKIYVMVSMLTINLNMVTALWSSIW